MVDHDSLKSLAGGMAILFRRLWQGNSRRQRRNRVHRANASAKDENYKVVAFSIKNHHYAEAYRRTNARQRQTPTQSIVSKYTACHLIYEEFFVAPHIGRQMSGDDFMRCSRMPDEYAALGDDESFKV